MNIKSKLDKNGYVIVKDVLPMTTITKAKNAIKASVDQQLTLFDAPKPKNIHDSLQCLFASDPSRYKDTISSLWRLCDIYNVLQHKKIQKILTNELKFPFISIAGGQVVHIQSKKLQIPSGYFGLPAHQDFPSVNGSLDGVIIWTPLIENKGNQFPLQIIPKSHLNGVLPTQTDSDIPWQIATNQYSEGDFISVSCELTDIVIMSTFTVHRSGIEGKSGLKLSCSTRFDNVSERSFIDNGYPSAYIRSVDRELYKTNPYLSAFQS